MGVTMLLMAFGVADKMGVVQTDVAKRGIGLVIGIMIVLTVG